MSRNTGSAKRPLFPPQQIHLPEKTRAQDSFTVVSPTSTPSPSSPVPLKNILVIGAGYVGLPTAAVIALHHPTLHLTLVDIDRVKVDRLNRSFVPESAEIPLLKAEPGLQYLLRLVRDGTEKLDVLVWDPVMGGYVEEVRHKANLEIRWCGNENDHNKKELLEYKAVLVVADMIIIAIDTEDLLTSMTSIIKWVKDETILVVKSTVPIGEIERFDLLVQTLRPNSRLEVIANPEFLSAGSIIANLLHPDRVVIGARAAKSGVSAAHVLYSIFSKWVPIERILLTDIVSAQMIKLASNSILAQRVSTANSIRWLCKSLDADTGTVLRGIGMDSRIGTHYLTPGSGYAGLCLSRSVQEMIQLADGRQLSEIERFWREVEKVNGFSYQTLVDDLTSLFKEMSVWCPSRLAILGYAFKAHVADVSGSVVPKLITSLNSNLEKIEIQLDKVNIWDPLCEKDHIMNQLQSALQASDAEIEVHSNPRTACYDSQVILIMNSCPELDCQWLSTERAPKGELDAIRLLARSELAAKGFRFDALEIDGENQVSIDAWAHARLNIPFHAANAVTCSKNNGGPTERENGNTLSKEHKKQPQWMEYPRKAILDCTGMLHQTDGDERQGKDVTMREKLQRLGFRVEELGWSMSKSQDAV